MKKNYGNEVLRIIGLLAKEHPSYTIAKHIFTALEEYGDPGGVTNKEFAFALEKYRAELEYHIVPEDELNQIIEEGENIDKLFKKDPWDPEEEEL